MLTLCHNYSSCYTAATLELSQPEIEEQKERFLAAATTELERFFKKEDFSRMKVVSILHIVILYACNINYMDRYLVFSLWKACLCANINH